MNSPSNTFQWTDEHVDHLKRLHAEGLTYAQIVAAIGGGLTRNAALGKAHRLKLPKGKVRQGQAPKPRPEGRRIVVRRSPEPPVGSTLHLPPVLGVASPALRGAAWDALPDTVPVPLEQATGCRWPIGADLPFLFCNAEADGRYCAAHERMSCHAR